MHELAFVNIILYLYPIEVYISSASTDFIFYVYNN